MPVNNQSDLVKNFLTLNSESGQLVTDRVRIPELESLPSKSKEEIAETLTLLLKSRSNLKKIVWELGQPFVELTYLSQ